MSQATPIMRCRQGRRRVARRFGAGLASGAGAARSGGSAFARAIGYSVVGELQPVVDKPEEIFEFTN